MKKVLILFLCITLLCGCSVKDVYTNTSSPSSFSQIDELDTSPTISNESKQNLPSKIYKAKNTASYSKDLLFPNSSNSVNTEEYFYYSSLPEKLKKLYKTLCLSIENMADGFIELGNITDDEISLLVSAIKNDKPEYFWLGRDYVINTIGKNSKEIAFKFNSDDYSIDYLFTPKQRDEIFAKIKTVISSLDNKLLNKTDYEKELIIHDFVINNCKYDEAALKDSSNENVYNIYGSLVQKKAVCEGYAKAIQLLNNHYGVKTTVVVGSSNNQNHMWNMVEIENNYYHLDATFNDGDTSTLYSYFNLSDGIIKRTHAIDSSFYKNITLPKANSLEMSYFAVNNSLIKDDAKNDIKNAIENAVKNQKTFVELGYSENVTKIYKNNDEMIKDKIDIAKTLTLSGMKNKVKISNIKLLFASNGNFKIMWDYE